MKKLLLLFCAAIMLLSLHAQGPTVYHKLKGFPHGTEYIYDGQDFSLGLRFTNPTNVVTEREYELRVATLSVTPVPLPATIDLGVVKLNPNEEIIQEDVLTILAKDAQGGMLFLRIYYRDKGKTDWVQDLSAMTYEWRTGTPWMTGDMEVPNSVKKGEPFILKYPMTDPNTKAMAIGLYTLDSKVFMANEYKLVALLDATKNGNEYTCTVPNYVASGTYYLIPLYADSYQGEWESVYIQEIGNLYSGYNMFGHNNKAYVMHKDNFVVENDGYKGLVFQSLQYVPSVNAERNSSFIGKLADSTSGGYTGTIGVAVVDGDTEIIVGEQNFINAKGQIDFNIKMTFPRELVLANCYLKLKAKPQGITTWSDVEIEKSLNFAYPIKYSIPKALPYSAPASIFAVGQAVDFDDLMTVRRMKLTNTTDEVIAGHVGFVDKIFNESPIIGPTYEFKYIYNSGGYVLGDKYPVEIQPGQSVEVSMEMGGRAYGVPADYYVYPMFKQVKDGVAYTARLGESIGYFKTYRSYGGERHSPSILEDLAVTKTEISQEERFDIIADFYDYWNKFTPVYGLYKLQDETRDLESKNYELVYKLDGAQDQKIPTSIAAGEYTIIVSQDETVPVNFEYDAQFNEIFQSPMLSLRHVDITLKQATATSIENEVSAGLRVYPNPVKDVLNIKSEEVINSIEILNVAGSQVLTEQVGANETVIQMSHLSSGVYILKVKTETGITIQKIKKN